MTLFCEKMCKYYQFANQWNSNALKEAKHEKSQCYQLCLIFPNFFFLSKMFKVEKEIQLSKLVYFWSNWKIIKLNFLKIKLSELVTLKDFPKRPIPCRTVPVGKFFRRVKFTSEVIGEATTKWTTSTFFNIFCVFVLLWFYWLISLKKIHSEFGNCSEIILREF